MSLARILGKSKGRQSFASDSRWVLPTSFIGLEHEYEGVKDQTLPNHSFADFWTYHEEGSLKDHGAEYVYAAPLFGLDANNALEWLVSHAKNSGWKCTKRTGIHVHLDVRDLTAPQFAGLCIIYAAVEPILYHWVGDGRDVSHFCIPLYRADEALLGACSIIKAALQDDKQDGHSASDVAAEYQRYAGFNLQALQKFGSIEFRQLQTTHDVVRIQDWINMVMSLKATALKLPQSDGAVVRMIQRMGVRELLSYVFPAQLATKLYTPKSEEEFVTQGLPSARDIAVHGCGAASWVKRDFPKGAHEGFVKWSKSIKKATKKSEEDQVLEEYMERAPGVFIDDRIEGEEGEDAQPRVADEWLDPPRPRPVINPQAAPVFPQGGGLRVDWPINRNYEAMFGAVQQVDGQAIDPVRANPVPTAPAPVPMMNRAAVNIELDRIRRNIGRNARVNRR